MTDKKVPVTPPVTPKTTKTTKATKTTKVEDITFIANSTVFYIDPETKEVIKFDAGDKVSGLSQKHIKALGDYLDKD